MGSTLVIPSNCNGYVSTKYTKSTKLKLISVYVIFVCS
jgi:hypothetical protein